MWVVLTSPSAVTVTDDTSTTADGIDSDVDAQAAPAVERSGSRFVRPTRSIRLGYAFYPKTLMEGIPPCYSRGCARRDNEVRGEESHPEAETLLNPFGSLTTVKYVPPGKTMPDSSGFGSRPHASKALEQRVGK
jgi:hypothetical protein